jgi:hypothetical protein
VAFAVNTAAVATPFAPVVAVLTPPAKLPLAPLPGAANVTVTPPTGWPFPSVTVAWNWVANAVLMAALCGVPNVAVMPAGTAGAARFVREKLAAVAAPETLAVTR